jgi:pSer/pThr/pTyr-binding forkhead associated (FHA) protein
MDALSGPITQRIDRLPTMIPLLASPQDSLDSTRHILLQFLPSALVIPVSLSAPVVLGRHASSNQTRPNDLLDLSHLDANRRGVSRQHCQLERQSGSLFITDLNSTNGTYLNGTRLTAYKPYRLADGDRLILSTLHCTVVFVTTP